MLSACSKDEVSLTGAQREVPLSVAEASVEASGTKGTFDTGGTLTNGGTMGLFVSGTGYTGLENVEYDYDEAASAWIPEGDTVFLSNNPATLTAVAPYTPGLDYKAAALTAQKYSEAADLCVCAAVTARNTAPQVSFSLEHVYARITFTISKDASYTGAGAVSKITLDNGAAICPSATADLSVNPEVITFGATGTVAYDPGIGSITTGAAVTTGALLVPSANFTNPTTVSFTVDGTVISALLPASAPASGGLNELLAGNNYQVAVTIKATALTIGSVSVTDWTMQAVPGEIIAVPTD